MKSEEYNFQLKQCGLYKAPPFQVRWGNIKLFYNRYIVCTQKNLWIHVSCQASFGIFSKRGKLSFFQRKPPKETSAPYQLSLRLLPKCQTITLTSELIGMPGCWETETWHWSPLVLFIKLRYLWGCSLQQWIQFYRNVPRAHLMLSTVSGTMRMPRKVRPHLDLNALSIY